MHVQAAEGRQVQHRLRQDGAVGGHADDVGLERGQLGLHGLVAQRARFEHGQPQALGGALHRRRFQLPAAPAHGVGAGVHGRHLVLLGQVLQYGGRELRRAHEHDAHGQRTRVSSDVSPGFAPAARASS